MKQILFFPFVLFFAVPLQAQVDTLQLGDRLPNLYYWDTNWIDSKLSMYPYCITTLQENLQSGNIFWGRPCVTDVPLKVIGIAAPAFLHILSHTCSLVLIFNECL